MAKQIVSGNLNEYGNSGNFESDRSTWGFADTTDYTVIRSSVQKTGGLYSALVTKVGTGNSLLIPFRFSSPVVGKKYLVKTNVRTPTALAIGSNEAELTMDMSLDNFLFGCTVLESETKTVLEAKDTWVEISLAVSYVGSLFFTALQGYVRCTSPNLGGQIFIDQLEIYEYIDAEDPEDPEEPGDPDQLFDKIYHSKNPITLTKTAPSNWLTLPNYQLYTDVRVEDVADSGEYNSKLIVSLIPDNNRKGIFYLNAAFRGVFTFNAPLLNQSEIVRLTDRIKRFKTYSGATEEDQETPEELTESLVDIVVHGGVGKFQFPGLNYFTQYVPENKKFLTWAPVEKYVDRLQEDYLTFWCYDDFGELKLNIKVYFDDGTDSTQIITTKTNVLYGELYQIPAGPQNTGVLLIDPEKNVVKYELTLLDHDNLVISEVRTYHINLVRHPLSRYFMFLNSLGGFEVLLFTGQARDKTEFKREIIQKVLPHNYKALDGEFSSNSVIMQEQKSFSSGFIRNGPAREWHEYMKDFLLSPIIYFLNHGLRFPVVITSSDHNNEDQNYERFFRFETKPAYDNESFTPDEI